MMTFAEFEMHRPKLAKSLATFANSGIVESVLPDYEENMLFSALIFADIYDVVGKVAVCVKSTHPAAMLEEETPGEPTWWWEDDLSKL